MVAPDYSPPWWLRNGLALTLYTALWQSRHWQTTIAEPQPPYQSHVFTGAGGVPIYGWMAKPEQAQATIVGTYGITGSLDNQWFLQILGRLAFAAGFAVVLFDWRGHGQTAAFSPTLTSDGLYEGTDFVQIAAQAKQMGYPSPFWFTGYSLGGQLALWGIKAAAELDSASLNLSASEIGGAAVICPNLESQRSLTYLLNHPLGRYLERAIAKELKKLAWQINEYHPGSLDPNEIERANHIIEFDHELVINRLGFPDVEAYYQATSPLYILPHLNRPTLILYAANDPMFIPELAMELKEICATNPWLELILTPHGGHVSHFSSQRSQHQAGDSTPWWAWHRILTWFQAQAPSC